MLEKESHRERRTRKRKEKGNRIEKNLCRRLGLEKLSLASPDILFCHLVEVFPARLAQLPATVGIRLCCRVALPGERRAPIFLEGHPKVTFDEVVRGRLSVLAVEDHPVGEQGYCI